MTNRFISTAIPYVNALPHVGFALELVLADVVARHARQRGERVYFLSGTIWPWAGRAPSFRNRDGTMESSSNWDIFRCLITTVLSRIELTCRYYLPSIANRTGQSDTF